MGGEGMIEGAAWAMVAKLSSRIAERDFSEYILEMTRYCSVLMAMGGYSTVLVTGKVAQTLIDDDTWHSHAQVVNTRCEAIGLLK